MGAVGIDGFVSDIAMDLRDAYAASVALEATPPAQTCLIHTELGPDLVTAGTVQDMCCEGFAWVRVVGIAPETPGPDIQLDSVGCAIVSWRVSLELGIARCQPWGTTAAGPTCDQLTAVALQQLQDAAAMRRAVCEWAPLLDTARYSVSGWVPGGPDGNCVYGTMQVAAIVDACSCGAEAVAW